MIVTILRFLRGYVQFSVCGRYPERFINIALKNRIRLWNVVRKSNSLTACMYMRDYRRIRRLARASCVRLHVCDRRGLPTFLKRYSGRIGAVIGAAVFVLTVFVMSLFIWSIDVTGLEGIGESEMRSLLRENGIYVGAFKPAVDYRSVSRAIMLADKRVGWMAINVTGSYASVEIKEESPTPTVDDVDVPCNVKARCDGRILRINAEEGTTMLKEGSGVVEGQVVVSGVMEDQLGGVRLVRAKAEVIAETDHQAEFHVPEAVTVCRPTGEVRRRLTADLFGWQIPLTVGSVSTVDVLTDEVEEVPAPLDVKLPAGILTQTIHALEIQEMRLNYNSAKELSLKEARLYEAFSLSDCTVTGRDYQISRRGGEYILRAEYTCSEDIARQDNIGIEK